MKVTFLDLPSFKDGKRVEKVFGCTHTVYPIPNVFSLTMASILENEGYETEYYDVSNEKWSKKKFIDFIEKDESDLYVIHSVNLSMDSDIKNAKLIKNIDSSSRVIFTGPAPTYFPNKFLENKDFFVIKGEPFEPIRDLVKKLSKNTLENNKEFFYSKEERIIKNENDVDLD
ncbi:MAG: cobalamin-dependent protein, partial [Halanaerobiales bacterium]